jgi:isochorismate hydrolase
MGDLIERLEYARQFQNPHDATLGLIVEAIAELTRQRARLAEARVILALAVATLAEKDPEQKLLRAIWGPNVEQEARLWLEGKEKSNV